MLGGKGLGAVHDGKTTVTCLVSFVEVLSPLRSKRAWNTMGRDYHGAPAYLAMGLRCEPQDHTMS
jgi:hypothetical protein